MPITNEKYIEAVETVDNDAENIRRSGTYAYAPQTDSEKGCAAAVSYWKEAHVKLGNLPPVYEGNTDVYAESRSRSLVALYSAKDDATISCAYITCPVSITNTTTVSTPTEPTDGGEEEEEDPPNEETPPLEPVNCRDEFNAARESAGLEPFAEETTAAKKLPIGDETYIKEICKAIQEARDCFSPGIALHGVSVALGTSVGKTTAAHKRSGTYAYAPQAGPANGCSAAVSYWKQAHVNFDGVPPEYDEEEKGVYAESQNRSLVALYNPQSGATVDCAFITCPLPATSTTTASPTTEQSTTEGQTETPTEAPTEPPTEAPTSPEGPSYLRSPSEESQGSATAANAEKTQSQKESGPTVRRLSTESETVTSLVCLMNPAALVQAQKPFSYVV
ncbi:SAG family member [Eimeria mitis]|uniref:SAG family member n=1 Tax=Eimeria mitis TaxID=44415 RepID=U6K2A3_9EIME|nr:SAG family member [Eimeria mitis]CDJ31830.1 SAG family member [Eimeria mitis]